MRALFVVHSYYLRDTRPRRLAAALAAAGWKVDVVCARDEGEPFRQNVGGVRIYRMPARRRRGTRGRYIFEYVSFLLMAFGSVTVLWSARRHQAVYVIGVPNFIVFSALVPRAAGSRVLLDMRDPLPEFFRAKYGFGVRHPITRVLLAEERMSARFATHVVTVHHSMAGLYTRSVPPTRISVVLNLPDPGLFAPDPEARRDGRDRTMLYAGTVARRYGVDLAVRGLARLRDEIPHLRLRIVGDGDFLPEVKEIALAEGVLGLVDFAQPVPLDKIPRIIQESWIGLQPNRDDPLMRYSLSAKILEWCRLGLPVVAGETLPLVELFSPDELLFHAPDDLDEMCERIREAHRDPEALAKRVDRARTIVERLNFADEMAAFERVVTG